MTMWLGFGTLMTVQTDVVDEAHILNMAPAAGGTGPAGNKENGVAQVTGKLHHSCGG